MRTSTSITLHDLSREEWNALPGTAQPFLRHEFLSALERHGCVGPGTGWLPCHLTVRDESGRLAGALPLYRKDHSWGEFVFDFAWAQAYAQNGLEYYPKLLCAVPFTPAGGPRFLGAPHTHPVLLEAALDLARAENLSSFHVLFPDAAQAGELAAQGLLLRQDCQFHWHNRNYSDFEQFLAQFTAEKRKKAHRERRRIREAGITFRTLHGGDIDRALWQRLYDLHAGTFHRHGHQPYLTRDFFQCVAAELPHSVVVQLAEHGGEPVAAAICFRSEDTLYGRYWGSAEQFHSLHFETCYYQGIEYCIREGLQRFEPGTQGEHKISRGFVPAYTTSAHWIRDPRFRHAIGDYLKREAQAVEHYAADVQAHVPYKQDP